MSYKARISFILGLVLLLIASVAQAQDPQPTPTNTPRPTPTNMAPPTSPPPAPSANVQGSIRGVVYADVTGNGRCVNTGVAGETAVPNVPIEFMSSDEKTIITHTSGENGVFELAAAGESYWRVTAKPPAGWVVTSENPRYAPIYPETPLATDVNFCVMRVTAVPLPAPPTSGILLPDSGAPANSAANISLWLAIAGFGLILVGLFLQRQQRAK